MQIRQYMNVIFNPVDLEQDAVFIPDDSPDVFVQLDLMLWIDGRYIVFRPEDDVVEDLTMAAHSMLFYHRLRWRLS